MRVRTGTLARLTIAVAGIVALAGCGGSPGTPTDTATSKLAVVATTTQVADFVRNVGGDKVTVTQIVKANVDPHDYEPSPADIAEIGRAKVVVKNGVGLETWLEETVTAANFNGPVVDASQGITLREGGEHHEGDAEPAAGEEEHDPHVWQNPQNAKTMAANIATALAAADAANASFYQQSLATYQAKLDELDADIETKINTIPAAQRKLVTDHDALGYYIDRYKLEFVGSVIPTLRHVRGAVRRPDHTTWSPRSRRPA